MAQDNIKNIDTVIVLRNDQTTNWESSTHVMLPGEVGIGYLKRTDKNGNEVTNVIAKLGNGVDSWKDLPQIEGVFENDVTLTYNFGRHTTKNGYVVTPAKGMTTSQWLIDALAVTEEPDIEQPTFSMTASTPQSGAEIGSYITTLNCAALTTYGKYEYGPATGLSASNVTWKFTDSVTEQPVSKDGGSSTNNSNKPTETKATGSFALNSSNRIQLTQETSKNYATITGEYTMDVTGAATPINNVGAETTGKITGSSTEPTKITGTITAQVAATAYRKPFWGALATALDVNALTSDIIRDLPNEATKTKGLPSSLTVAATDEMVIFAAKSGTYSSLTAVDEYAMNSSVSFEKKAKAVQVEGANEFTATDYDIWYVNFPGGPGAAMKLKLTWA